MSHDHDNGGLLASMKLKPRASGSSSQPQADRLERPSLFAGMEDDEVEDIESDRVRLLSSVSVRGGHNAGSKTGALGGRRPGKPRAISASAWWPRALFAAMGLGAMLVLYSFVQVVREPHAMSARARALSAATPGSVPSILPGTGTAPNLEALAPTAAGPVDGEVASAQALAASASPATPATFQEASRTASPTEDAAPGAVITEVQTAPPATRPAAAAPSVKPHQVTVPTWTMTSALIARAQSDAARLNAPAASSVTRPASPRDTRPRTNEDVALLEAMMKHASARRAPPSMSEAFQACDAREGADAAVCKARACVQHPTATQCHSDAP